ncbi:MAG: hypothetical protein JRJ85_00730 [Deltaproteobacteria bacterium]|nr:hypothetical protein [Deltaproteobacteria bacterium]
MNSPIERELIRPEGIPEPLGAYSHDISVKAGLYPHTVSTGSKMRSFRQLRVS